MNFRLLRSQRAGSSGLDLQQDGSAGKLTSTLAMLWLSRGQGWWSMWDLHVVVV